MSDEGDSAALDPEAADALRYQQAELSERQEVLARETTVLPSVRLSFGFVWRLRKKLSSQSPWLWQTSRPPRGSGFASAPQPIEINATGDFNQISGDWAGYGARYLEEEFQ